MATRLIVTSQPDVACDVCARRLLRGEQPVSFLAAGHRRTVCELCAPRATHEGWLRESSTSAVGPPALRTRRGRNLLDRLRQVGKPANGAAPSPAADQPASEPEPYDFLDALAVASDEPHSGSAAPDGLASQGSRTERAIATFNAGEHPRRLAGVARSLGAPTVSVRPDEDVENLVSIVISWELCWYRYAVDLDDREGGVRVLAQGNELGELAHEERLANAVADELGALSPMGA